MAGFAQVPTLDTAQAQDDAVHFLADLIRIDSQDLPGNETKVAHYLEGVLKDAGIEAEILETVPGRDSIVSRLKGDGSTPSAAHGPRGRCPRGPIPLDGRSVCCDREEPEPV